MDICSDGHEEVVYEGRNCPACEINQEYEDTIRELSDYIESLETENNELIIIKNSVIKMYPECVI